MESGLKAHVSRTLRNEEMKTNFGSYMLSALCMENVFVQLLNFIGGKTEARAYNRMSEVTRTGGCRPPGVTFYSSVLHSVRLTGILGRNRVGCISDNELPENWAEKHAHGHSNELVI